MMFGTDHPFSISDPPKNYEALCPFDLQVKDSILHQNASNLMNILTPKH